MGRAGWRGSLRSLLALALADQAEDFGLNLGGKGFPPISHFGEVGILRLRFRAQGVGSRLVITT
jgi:hypothetical protein